MKIFLKIIIVLFAFFYISSVHAAVWYVDNAAPGSNNGTSWTNAWTGFSEIVWGSTGVIAGDTLYISGGSTSKTYSETLTIGASGSVNALITIRVGQDAGHNGKVIIDAQNTRWPGIYSVDQTYIHLNGNYDGNKNIKVVNSYIVNGAARDLNNGLGVYIGSNSIIEYIEIEACMNGVAATSQTNVELRYNYIHDIRGDSAVRVNNYTGTNFLNFYVHHNIIEVNADFTNNGVGNLGGPDGIVCTNGLTVHDNIVRAVPGTVIGGQHPDGVQAMGNYVKIYNNYFSNWFSAAIFLESWDAACSCTEFKEQYIWNNVIAVDSSAFPTDWPKGIDVYPFSSTGSPIKSISNVYIVNNTFIDINGTAIVGTRGGFITSVSNVAIKNNIFYNCGRAVNGVVLAWDTWDKNLIPTGFAFDYNLVNAGADGGVTLKFNGLPLSQFHGQSGVPSFTNYNKRTTGNNLTLQSSDTAAIDLGTNLSSVLAAFAIDQVGNNRTDSWDIGAFEISGKPEPIAPTGLRVLP